MEGREGGRAGDGKSTGDGRRNGGMAFPRWMEPWMTETSHRGRSHKEGEGASKRFVK